MLTWVAVLCVLGAAVAVGAWALRRVDSLGRPRPFPAVTVVLLLVVALAAAIPVVRQHRLESRLSAVATALVGSAVTIDCQSRGQELVDLGHELGWVRYDAQGRPEPHALIKRRPCERLAEYLRSDREQPSLDQVIAVHVLAHEAAHMAGETVEGRAECMAVQRDARTAGLLGATPEQARALARRYWTEVYPGMPEGYRSSDCVPGGPLDERLPDPPWS